MNTLLAEHADFAASSIDSGLALRRRAEAKLKADEAQTPARLSRDETLSVLHELQVHQIELELQNEELRATQAELEASRARYFELYDLAPVGYVPLDEQGLILEANLTAAGLLGVARNALVKQPLTRFILPADQDLYYLHRKRLFETGAPQACELRLVRPDGSQFWARLETTAALGAAGAQDSSTTDGFARLRSGPAADGAPVCRTVISDITDRVRSEQEQQQVEEELRRASGALETAARELQQSLAREQRLARTDGLTGLCNRRQFFELAARELSAAVRYSRPLAILMFDADDFKQINDTLGHAAGDQVLAQLAQTVAAKTRAVDVLARYGGDEFVILLPQTSAQQALPVADHIRESVAAMRLETDQGFASVTLSIGIAELWRMPADQNIESVVRRADQALYTAKAEGRNCTVIFSAETQGSQP
jgi:diguanylate cyclase (GGDEF)-like protein/PAS domain S-box-containing protein